MGKKNKTILEKKRDNLRRWRKNNREYYNKQQQKYRAKHKKEQKAFWLKKKYNLSLAEYQRMFESQNGVCAICGQPEVKHLLVVDHDHKTGKIRGLLCAQCNLQLGVFEKRYDDFIDYLEK